MIAFLIEASSSIDNLSRKQIPKKWPLFTNLDVQNDKSMLSTPAIHFCPNALGAEIEDSSPDLANLLIDLCTSPDGNIKSLATILGFVHEWPLLGFILDGATLFL